MDVAIDVTAPVAWVTVHRPEARNAMTFAAYQALYDACEALDADPAVRVVIVRGGGGTFIAGTDIREFVTLRTAEDALAYERRISALADRLERMTKTTIAAIEGAAVGGGLTIALACHLRYAASDARLGVPIARTLGNCLSMANTARLVEAVGPGRARELLLTARLVDAGEAHAIGLINGVVPAGGLERHVLEVAEKITSNAPLTVQVSKEAIRRILQARRGVEGDDLIVQCYTSEDFRGAVKAFLEKRSPLWAGR
jgi:enoyl-CoA hydratase/carnithine racemase